MKNKSAGRKAHAKAGARQRRCLARIAAKKSPFERSLQLSQASWFKHIAGAQSLSSGLDTADLRIARGGYGGIRDKEAPKIRTVEELLTDGFTYIAWDGKYVQYFGRMACN